MKVKITVKKADGSNTVIDGNGGEAVSKLKTSRVLDKYKLTGDKLEEYTYESLHRNERYTDSNGIGWDISANDPEDVIERLERYAAKDRLLDAKAKEANTVTLRGTAVDDKGNIEEVILNFASPTSTTYTVEGKNGQALNAEKYMITPLADLVSAEETHKHNDSLIGSLSPITSFRRTKDVNPPFSQVEEWQKQIDANLEEIEVLQSYIDGYEDDAEKVWTLS